jgi:hypothetical protein
MRDLENKENQKEDQNDNPKPGLIAAAKDSTHE